MHAQMNTYLPGLVKCGVRGRRHDCFRPDGSQRNLRSAAYEALMEMVKNSPKVQCLHGLPFCHSCSNVKAKLIVWHWQFLLLLL